MDKIRVLLIDDEPSFTRMLKMSLERRGGFEVMVENNGAYGLTVAQDFRPDFILLDVIMPDVDGGEVAAKIRADSKLKDTPIVFLTAGVSKDTTKAKGNVIGGQKYLAKPVTVDEVIRCIEARLGKTPRVSTGSSPVPKS
ncbi:MAG: response regulator [Candidatus Eisenbacteria bacterium]|uniref:Response regulator n=1 Tax=Eiseniibacteriota bacterium TaxID=2212470 RepID=A0A538T556_UNCEI|nr:MAG: response regulator [Candidatus Eisenbacteria bacterium]